MRFKAFGLLVGALVAADIALVAPTALAQPAQAPTATHFVVAVKTYGNHRIPNNNANKGVPHNVNSAMNHLKSAYTHAAAAQVEVIQGKFKDASNDIKAAENSLNSAQKVKDLPEHVNTTIRNLQARLPKVKAAIDHQQASARTDTADFLSAMAKDVGNIEIATTKPVGGGAGPKAATPAK